MPSQPCFCRGGLVHVRESKALTLRTQSELAMWPRSTARYTKGCGQIDGVRSAGLVSHLPLVNFGHNGYFEIEGESP